MAYGRAIEIHVKGGGKLNTIPFVPGQKQEAIKANGDHIMYSEEGAIKHAKRLMTRWYATDQFAGAHLFWRKV